MLCKVNLNSRYYEARITHSIRKDYQVVITFSEPAAKADIVGLTISVPRDRILLQENEPLQALQMCFPFPLVEPPQCAWENKCFRARKSQFDALQGDEMKRVLQENHLVALNTTVSDVRRNRNSWLGQNASDVTFFAVPPEHFWGKNLKGRLHAHFFSPAQEVGINTPRQSINTARQRSTPASCQSDFVEFPALRLRNTDFEAREASLRAPGEIDLCVRNRQGDVVNVTLEEFLSNIGHFITDLPETTSWSCPVDCEKIEVGRQWSVLPTLAGAQQAGLRCSGYRGRSLHVLIGPGGALGWAPDRAAGSGYTGAALFPRDNRGGLAAMRLENGRTRGKRRPEDSEQEISIEYDDAEGLLYHIEIELVAPASPTLVPISPSPPEDGSADGAGLFALENAAPTTAPLRRPAPARPGDAACDWAPRPDGAEAEWVQFAQRPSSEVHPLFSDVTEDTMDDTPFVWPERSKIPAMKRFPHNWCDVSEEELDSSEWESSEFWELDAPLCSLGGVVGPAGPQDGVPATECGRFFARAPRAPVRVTEIYFRLADDGELTAARVRSFCDKMKILREEVPLERQASAPKVSLACESESSDSFLVLPSMQHGFALGTMGNFQFGSAC